MASQDHTMRVKTPCIIAGDFNKDPSILPSFAELETMECKEVQLHEAGKRCRAPANVQGRQEARHHRFAPCTCAPHPGGRGHGRACLRCSQPLDNHFSGPSEACDVLYELRTVKTLANRAENAKEWEQDPKSGEMRRLWTRLTIRVLRTLWMEPFAMIRVSLPPPEIRGYA